MSTELYKGNGPHELSLTQFGGGENGLCIQITGGNFFNGEKKTQLVCATVEEAAALGARLSAWAAHVKRDGALEVRCVEEGCRRWPWNACAECAKDDQDYFKCEHPR